MNTQKWQNGLSILQSLLILGGLMIVGLFITSLIMGFIVNGEVTRKTVLWGSVFQNIFAFIIPVILLPAFIGKKADSWLGIDKLGNPWVYLFIIITVFASLPAMSWLIDINEGISFPESLSEFESRLRDMENKGSQSAKLILNNSNIAQLIASILVVGILTGIGEEFYFRGGIQNILSRNGVSPSWAIFLAAAIFSAVHFQFFGFLPRLVLGGWFGWLYWKTKSIWTAVIAHSINNSIVVFSSWAISKDIIPENFEMFGTPERLSWVVILFSILLSIILIFIINRLRSNPSDNH